MAYNGLPLLVKQGGTGNSSDTAYAPIIGGTTSTAALQQVALGASGTVYKGSGSSAVPTWGLVNSWKFLASRNAAAASAKQFNSVISSTYFTYALIMNDITSTAGTPSLKMQVSTNNGSSFIATNYQGGSTRFDWNSTTITDSLTDTTLLYLTMPIGSGVHCSGICYIQNVGNGGQVMISGNCSNGNFTQNIMGYNTATTVNSLRIFMDGGNTYSGNLYLYGIQEF